MPTPAQPAVTPQFGPIGVLDSGVGGLSILRALRALLPAESFLYVADQAHLPYGPRPLDEIQRFVHGITDFLLARQAKLIVVACNAASAASLHYLRVTFPDVPFVGMEPAVKPAAAATRSGVVAVLTTAATAGGPLYASVLARFANGVHVHTVVCPELVQAVEANQASLADLRPVFDRSLAQALAAGADQLVLGCTHFPFAADAIQAYAGPYVTLVDPSPAVASQTRHVLDQHDLRHPGDDSPTLALFTSGDAARFSALASSLLDEPVTGIGLTWQLDGLQPQG
jgi:glutamate racemase